MRSETGEGEQHIPQTFSDPSPRWMTHGQLPSLRHAKELEMRADPTPRSTFDIFDTFDVDSRQRQNEKKVGEVKVFRNSCNSKYSYEMCQVIFSYVFNAPGAKTPQDFRISGWKCSKSWVQRKTHPIIRW